MKAWDALCYTLSPDGQLAHASPRTASDPAGSVLGVPTSPWEVQEWGGQEGPERRDEEISDMAQPFGSRASGCPPLSHPAGHLAVYQPVKKKKVVLT